MHIGGGTRGSKGWRGRGSIGGMIRRVVAWQISRYVRWLVGGYVGGDICWNDRWRFRGRRKRGLAAGIRREEIELGVASAGTDAGAGECGQRKGIAVFWV